MQTKLQWDDEAIAHIARHRVRPEEVEEATYDPKSFVVRISGRQKRYIVYGQTSSGRYLKVVIEALGQGFFRPVTTYEMDENDRRSFRRRVR